jgi:hypothetical protein
MDGILEELLRLENAKHHALLTLNSEVYEDSVQQQNSLIDNPGFSVSDRVGSGNLLAFSKLAGINTTLYENLLSTAPWMDVARSYYSGQGYRTDSPAAHGFSVEA